MLVTSPGRVRFNEIWPEGLGFINQTVGKKQIGDLAIIWRCYQVAGQSGTVTTLDDLKNLGFEEATRSGCSIGIIGHGDPRGKRVGDQEGLRGNRKGLQALSERYYY